MRLFLMVLSLLLSAALLAQGTYEDYKRAEKFLPENVRRLVAKTTVQPNWIGESSKFWYKNTLYDGKEFVFIDPAGNKREMAFDHETLATTLSKAVNETYTSKTLPFDTFEFTEDQSAIQFDVDSMRWEFNLNDHSLHQIEEAEEPAGLSPDKKWAAFIRDHNLYVRSLENDEEIQLTTDGKAYYDYAYQPNWYHLDNVSHPEPPDTQEPSVKWSPDSKKIFTFRLDRREIRRLYLLKSVTEKDFQAEVYSYDRALPGDSGLAMKEYVIFDIENKEKTAVDLGAFPAFLEWWEPEWFEDSKRLYYNFWHRGYHAVDLLEIDAETGKSRIILEERSKTNVDMGMMVWTWINEENDLIWASERDGWNHLYYFNGKSGKLRNQVTSGAFVVRSIAHADEETRQIFFSASGKETGRDPYLQHLYKVNFDGSGLTLLTPEDAEHNIDFSPDGKFFVDNFSRVDLAPKSVLRRSADGKIIRELEVADISRLLKTGWQPPEPFSAKARDGETDIYGAMYRPSTFDSTRKYPVIDASYTGPHTFSAPKSFTRGLFLQRQSIAELGFIVIAVDGLGSAKRSKAFHNFSYKNLGDIGAEDHMAAIRQLAERYSFIDRWRVGIYGHSAGGYDAARAMLIHPFFYDVGVASAGNHDHRMAKIWWPEMWMGPLGDHYDEQSNIKIARNLRGKLLLATGDMDNNVNPVATMRLADALMKANKDFDLLILPNATHSLGKNRYFIRKRWDYFVEHLLDVKPPKEYQIQPFDSWENAEQINALTDAEIEAGWELLFDGESLGDWREFGKDSLPAGWVINNRGELHFTGSGQGDIMTKGQFDDFEFSLEWRVSPAGNSGIMFRVTEEYDTPWKSGAEMQVLDNNWHPDGRSALTSAGANYALYPAASDVTREVGEFNEVRIVARKHHIEHWLNGEKIVEYETDSSEWEDLVKKSKFARYPGYGRSMKGHIVLQDHGDKVWYRNIKIRPLSND